MDDEQTELDAELNYFAINAYASKTEIVMIKLSS